MASLQIFYLVPHNTQPCGGIKVIYEHCRMLRTAGYDARPLHDGEFSIDWFGHEQQPLVISKLPRQLDSNVVLVANEVQPYRLQRFNGGRRLMFVQNSFQVLSALKRGGLDGSLTGRVRRRLGWFHTASDYQSLGYQRVLVCSSFLVDYLEQNLGVSASLVTNGIDLQRLVYHPERKEESTVLCLPRKRRDDLAAIKERVGDNVRFIDVDAVPFEELIAAYQRADVFLATGYPEGFSLPPLEAMACGCAVVGFTGGGGGEFMLDGDTALVAEDGDCAGAAEKLLKLLNDSSLKEDIRLRGVAKAQEYSRQRMQQELLSFYSDLAAATDPRHR